MLRGEIRLVDLDPARGSEANKRRPAVIVSNDRANSIAARLGRGVVTVVPVSSNTDRIFPFQTMLPAAATGLRHDSKAQAEQVQRMQKALTQMNVQLANVISDIVGQTGQAILRAIVAGLSEVLCLRHTMSSKRSMYAQACQEDAKSERSRAGRCVADDSAGAA